MIVSLVGPFRRSFDFAGRSRRREYWLFVAWQVPALLAALALGLGTAPEGEAFERVLAVPVLHLLVFGLPTLALQVRRMHDQDKTGLWIAVGALPYVGLGWLIYLMVRPGTWGPNRFGPDPRHPSWEGDLFE